LIGAAARGHAWLRGCAVAVVVPGLPPSGCRTRTPHSSPTLNGSTIGADNRANEGGVWFPDLRTREIAWGAGVMVKF
jgi:hypothetical protein